MKAELYLLEYMEQHHLTAEQVEQGTGTNLKQVVAEGRELLAEEFLQICDYLGITPDEVSDQIL